MEGKSRSRPPPNVGPSSLGLFILMVLTILCSGSVQADARFFFITRIVIFFCNNPAFSVFRSTIRRGGSRRAESLTIEEPRNYPAKGNAGAGADTNRQGKFCKFAYRLASFFDRPILSIDFSPCSQCLPDHQVVTETANLFLERHTQGAVAGSPTAPAPAGTA